MAYASISKPGLYFNTKLYTGTTNAQSITGVGFQPDMTWVKVRSTTAYGVIQDAVRGATGTDTYSLLTSAEAGDNTDAITSFDSDGFSLGTDANDRSNYSGQTHVAWNWKAGTGQGSSNTDGSINTTYTSVNTTAGFSISKYTGNGSANATVGHGLGVEPSMIIFKCLTHQQSWITYHKSLGTGHYLYLNNTDASSSASGAWCTPSASTFQLNQVFNATNTSGRDYIAYCFAEKAGYSKFGNYRGNGNANGTFVYTGFKPAFVLIRNTVNSSDDWQIFDNKRANTFNPADKILQANLSSAEGTSAIDLLSNGFKIRASSGFMNRSGETMIYMCFAEQPLVANVGQSIPATAR